jgi:hypothetical protein
MDSNSSHKSRGRPRKSSTDQRHRLVVSLSADQLAVLKREAKALGQTAARYARDRLLAEQGEIASFGATPSIVVLTLAGVQRSLEVLARTIEQRDGSGPALDRWAVLARLRTFEEVLRHVGQNLQPWSGRRRRS